MIQIPVEPQITEYLHRKAAMMGVPLNGTFELTPCCNMNCRMCYVRMSAKEQEAAGRLRTTKEWLDLAKVAKEQGMLYLLLTGGEPFLRPDLQELLEGLNQLGIVVSINTNGTLIDEATVEWLKKTPPHRFNITLYGASDETYERLCGNPKGFTQCTNAIRMLLDAGMIVKINCSVTPYNKEDLKGIFAFAEEVGVPCQATSYMFPPVRKSEENIGLGDRFTPAEAAYYSAKVTSLIRGEDAYVAHMEENKDVPPMEVPEDDCMEVSTEGIRCRAGKCSFWVTWKGDIMPCGMFDLKDAPNVFAKGFAESWAMVRQAAGCVRMPAKCTKCELKDECRPCAAMCYTETGAFDRVPEYRCQMTQQYYVQARVLAEELKKGAADEREE